MTPRVRLLHVTKRYGTRVVLRDASLDVADGEAVALLGPNGCGKTTLLRVIAGLESFDGGEVWLGDACVAKDGRSSVPSWQRQIGFVFQDLALWPHMTVTQHLTFVLRSMGVPRHARGERVAETLALVRLADLGERHPHQLSGGEQQRLALARALVGHPRLLLLDEPLASLDPDLRLAMREDLRSLRQLLGLTMIWVTHDHAEAGALSERVLRMRDGTLVE